MYRWHEKRIELCDQLYFSVRDLLIVTGSDDCKSVGGSERLGESQTLRFLVFS